MGIYKPKQGITYYSPNQLSVIYPFLEGFTPKWLLLGGPADANEAQTAVGRWPDIQVIGVDPNPNVIEWQKANGWPEGHMLLSAALSDKAGNVPISVVEGALRSSRVEPRTTTSILTPSLTWDFLDEMYGPFEDAILWMDIEWHELEAIKGAKNLLARGAVKLVNVELQTVIQDKCNELEWILVQNGFRAVKDWNDSDTCRDRIYLHE